MVVDVAALSPWGGGGEFAARLILAVTKTGRLIAVNLDVPQRATGPAFEMLANPATIGAPEVVAGLLEGGAGAPAKPRGWRLPAEQGLQGGQGLGRQCPEAGDEVCEGVRRGWQRRSSVLRNADIQMTMLPSRSLDQAADRIQW